MNNLKAKCPKCKFDYVIALDRQLIRTIPMNKLYWGVYIRTIADELGYFPDELHDELKLKFNPRDSKLNLGNKVGGSTTKMKRQEFSFYLERIKIWALRDYGIELPEPE